MYSLMTAWNFQTEVRNTRTNVGDYLVGKIGAQSILDKITNLRQEIKASFTNKELPRHLKRNFLQALGELEFLVLWTNLEKNFISSIKNFRSWFLGLFKRKKK